MRRCMADEEANRTFPDADQRYAFCSAQWSRGPDARSSARSGKGVFEFRNKTANAGEILLYGEIGDNFWDDTGITAKAFADQLKKLGNIRTLDLRIDSGGGSVTDARAIYTQLTQHKATVNVYVDGIAASAASFVAMAGDSISVAEGGFVMIHEARAVARGTASEMRKAAAVLEAVDETIAQTYVARTRQPKTKIRAWMAEETWFTGPEAVDAGFADQLMANKEVTACAYPEQLMKTFCHLPEALRPRRMRARQIHNRVRELLRETA